MGRTKKVKITGKFGVRYGVKVKKMIKKIEGQKTKNCPYCLKPALRRVHSGIWECKKCGVKFAGGAYKP